MLIVSEERLQGVILGTMESFSFCVSKFSKFNNNTLTKRSQRKYKWFSSCQQTEVYPVISAVSEQKADDMPWVLSGKWEGQSWLRTCLSSNIEIINISQCLPNTLPSATLVKILTLSKRWFYQK